MRAQPLKYGLWGIFGNYSYNAIVNVTWQVRQFGAKAAPGSACPMTSAHSASSFSPSATLHRRRIVLKWQVGA